MPIAAARVGTRAIQSIGLPLPRQACINARHRVLKSLEDIRAEAVPHSLREAAVVGIRPRPPGTPLVASFHAQNPEQFQKHPNVPRHRRPKTPRTFHKHLKKKKTEQSQITPCLALRDLADTDASGVAGYQNCLGSVSGMVARNATGAQEEVWVSDVRLPGSRGTPQLGKRALRVSSLLVSAAVWLSQIWHAA